MKKTWCGSDEWLQRMVLSAFRLGDCRPLAFLS
jgi:hypothetical protein